VRAAARRPVPLRLGDRTVITSMIDADAVTETELAPEVVTDISTALSTATAAQTTANGRNKIFYTTAAPTNPQSGYALVTGDLWFDSDNGYRLAQWNGSAWVDFGLGNAAIGSLDAGKITAGIISSIEIQGGTPVSGVYPFRVTTAGVVTASSGTVGGFTLSTTQLSASYSGGTVSGTLSVSSSGTIVSTYTDSAVAGGYASTVRVNDLANASGAGVLSVQLVTSVSNQITYYTASGSYTPSDSRIKNVIDAEFDALSVINAVDVVKFAWKADPTAQEHVGFLAQQLYENIKEAAIPGGEDAGVRPWMIAKEALIPYLAKSVQQLSDKIAALEARISELES